MNPAFKKEFIKLAEKIEINDQAVLNKDTYRSLISGLGAGALSAITLAPLDAVKDTMRTGGPGAGKTAIQTIRNLYQQGGIGRFYHGVGPAVLKLGLGMGITFGAANAIKNLLEKNEAERIIRQS